MYMMYIYIVFCCGAGQVGGHGAVEPLRQRGHGLQVLRLRRVRQGRQAGAIIAVMQ